MLIRLVSNPLTILSMLGLSLLGWMTPLMRLRRVNGCLRGLCTLKALVSVIRLKESSSCFHHLCDVLKIGG